MKKENGKSKDKMKDKAGPVVDPAAAQTLNMMVLKRYDADIEEVLANSAHVTMYTLNVDTKQWARKQVEGSLFLLKRKTSPKFQLLVLNKLSTDNYVETLHDALDFEVHPPYLMYTHGNDEVVGVWFYENQDLEKVAGILEAIKTDVPSTSQAPAPAPTPTAAPPQPEPAQEASAGNLQELLFRAHQRHQEQQRQVAQQPRAVPPAANGSIPVQAQNVVHPPPHIPIRPPPPQVQSTPPVQPADRRPQQPSPVPFGQQMGTPDAAPSPSSPSPSGQPVPPACNDGDNTNVLHKLFARAMQPTSTGGASTPPPAPKQPAPQQRTLPDSAVRDKVRQAFGRLLQNDAFVDMLALEFKSAGLLS